MGHANIICKIFYYPFFEFQDESCELFMKKIMIVEDEVILTMAVRRTLEDAGYEVLPPVLSGESAIELVGKNTPDLVLMDVTLQGELDGISAAEEIYKTLQIPIIVTTAHSDASMMKRIEASSCADYLLKPVNFNELLELVNKYLS